MSLNQDIRLRFSYNFSDWAEAIIFYNSRQFGLGDIFLLPLLGLSIYEFGLGFFLWQFYGLNGSVWTGVLWLVIVVVLKLELISLFVLWLKARRRGEESKRVYEFVFNDEGASYRYTDKTGSEDITQAWSQFKRLIESRKAFFLVYKSGGYWVLPKRYFANGDEMDSFRYLMKSKIGEQNMQSKI